MSVNQKFDDTLFEILKDCKVLPTFFDVIFGFLKRRSDFYILADDKDSPVGLPPGVAESIVKHTFYKWQFDGDIEYEPASPKKQPLITREKPTEIFTSYDCYNGATYENYSWSQSINEVDVLIQIPENTTPKQLNVSIQPQHLSVRLNTTNEVLIDGELNHKVKHCDAIWSLDKTKLEIHLEKTSEIWWDCLIESEPKLDVSKIDCSRPFEDLPEEAQAKIEEMTWNQERKRLGLPTSERIGVEDSLRRAWDAEGSPFSGPYDPDSVDMN